MADQTTNPHTVVVGVDYSESSKLALWSAFDAANRDRAEPHVVAVAGTAGPMLRVELPDEIAVVTLEEASDHLKKFVQDQLAEYKKDHETKFERVVTHVRVGAPAHEVAQLAADLEADLIVVGTHGRRGAQRLLLGSVAEATVRLAQCPVLVIRPKTYGSDVDAPKIEPPCADCVAIRKKTDGKELWCARHAEKHGRRHTYHYVDRNAKAQENPGLVMKED